MGSLVVPMAALALAVLVPTAQGNAQGVAVVGPNLKVRPTDQPSGAADAQLLAARNEFESFQIVVQAGQTPLQDVSVALAAPLAGPGGTIPGSNVTIYREGYYNVAVPSDQEAGSNGLGPWPDSLIPSVDTLTGQQRNAFPIDVPGGENRVAWVDVLVPENAAPGTYSGTIAVTGADLNVAVPVQLTVFDATLPSTANLTSAFEISWSSACRAKYNLPDVVDQVPQSCYTAPIPPSEREEEGWRLNALLLRAALDNRITVSYPHYQPLQAGNLPLFRKYTLPLLNGTGTALTRLRGAKLTSLHVDAGSSLAAWRAEAQAQGFADRAFIYACDEPGGSQANWNRCQQVASDARQVWPDVPILITASVDDANRFGAIGYIDRMVAIVNQMHDKPGHSHAGNQRRNYDPFLAMSPSKRVWLYASCMSHGCEPNRPIERVCQDSPAGPATSDPYFDGWPGYVIDAPASQARAMGWLAFLYEASGELYFQMTHCLREAETAQYAFGGNGDGTLFYPGDPQAIGGADWIPLEAIRLKLIRDGYEDYEYLKILADRQQGTAARAVANGLFQDMYTTNRGDADVQAARRQLAHLIDPANVP